MSGEVAEVTKRCAKCGEEVEYPKEVTGVYLCNGCYKEFKEIFFEWVSPPESLPRICTPQRKCWDFLDAVKNEVVCFDDAKKPYIIDADSHHYIHACPWCGGVVG